MMPPGSACSIAFGIGITKSAPGSAQGLHLVVPDIEAARAELADRGVDVGDVQHFEAGGMVPGPDPEGRDYGSAALFSPSRTRKQGPPPGPQRRARAPPPTVPHPPTSPATHPLSPNPPP